MAIVGQELFQFCGPSYEGESVRFDLQRSVNLYPESGLPNSKSKTMLVGTPGLTLLTTINAPVRALWAGHGRLFAIGGSHGYEVFRDGTVQDYGAMAALALLGPCQIVQGAGPGFQLLAMNSANNKLYSFNPAGGGSMDYAHFDGQALEYLDGFFVAIATNVVNTTQNQVNVSAPADGTTWPGLAVAVRTGSNDNLTRLAVMNGQLWLFGEKTIEIWYNVGASPFPFARVGGATINQGLLAPFSVEKMETLYWLGANDRGYASVYRANGSVPVRVSTFAIDSLIKNYLAQNISNLEIRSLSYEEAGHSFYVLSFPAPAGPNNAGAAVAYDTTTGQWHERFFLNGGALERPRAYCAASVNNFGGFAGGGAAGLNFVGDYATGNIYVQDLLTPNDNGVAIQRQRTCPYISNGNRWIKHRALEIYGDVGTAQMGLTFSDDGGLTFAHSRGLMAGSNNQGNAYSRFKWWQLGRSRVRAYTMTITDSVNPIRIVEAFLDVNPGNEQ